MGGSNWVFPLSPTARGDTKLKEYFAKVRNIELEVLEAQSGFGEISDVNVVSLPKQQSKIRMDSIENDMSDLEDKFARYQTRAANMFSWREMVGRRAMLNDLREIEKLSANEEFLNDSDARLGN